VEDNLPIDDYACTLLGVIIGDDASAFFQIGDGAIVVGENGNRSPVFWPQHHEYVNSTNFVTDKTAPAALNFEVRGRVDELALLPTVSSNSYSFPKLVRFTSPFFEQVFAPVRASSVDGIDGGLSRLLVAYLEKPLGRHYPPPAALGCKGCGCLALRTARAIP
jgi:hypothetical protein